MNAIVQFRKCTLTDSELIKRVDKLVDGMYKPPYKVPAGHIPAKPDDDFDLLIGELLVRFNERIKKDD